MMGLRGGGVWFVNLWEAINSPGLAVSCSDHAVQGLRHLSLLHHFPEFVAYPVLKSGWQVLPQELVCAGV